LWLDKISLGGQSDLLILVKILVYSVMVQISIQYSGKTQSFEVPDQNAETMKTLCREVFNIPYQGNFNFARKEKSGWVSGPKTEFTVIPINFFPITITEIVSAEDLRNNRVRPSKKPIRIFIVTDSPNLNSIIISQLMKIVGNRLPINLETILTFFNATTFDEVAIERCKAEDQLVVMYQNPVNIENRSHNHHAEFINHPPPHNPPPILSSQGFLPTNAVPIIPQQKANDIAPVDEHAVLTALHEFGYTYVNLSIVQRLWKRNSSVEGCISDFLSNSQDFPPSGNDINVANVDAVAVVEAPIIQPHYLQQAYPPAILPPSIVQNEVPQQQFLLSTSNQYVPLKSPSIGGVLEPKSPSVALPVPPSAPMMEFQPNQPEVLSPYPIIPPTQIIPNLLAPPIVENEISQQQFLLSTSNQYLPPKSPSIGYIESLSPRMEFKKPTCVCFEDIETEDHYICDCPQNHSFHHACILRHVLIALQPSAENEPHIPACPLANGKDGCAYAMEQQEIEKILNIGYERSDRKKSILDEDNGEPTLTKKQYEDVLQMLKNLFFRKVMQQMQCVRCPVCPAIREELAFWTAPPPLPPPQLPRINQAAGLVAAANTQSVWLELNGQLVDCPQCHVNFCASCHTTPYHYRVKCSEVMQYTRGWTEWLTLGRQEYLRQTETQQQQYLREAAQYEAAKATHEKEVQEARARFEELTQNEEWKAAHCRLCPNCNRAIEKLSGCDSMKCGEDYHGGNNQQGCGASFNWRNAQPYVPNTGIGQTQAELNARPPKEVQKTKYRIDSHHFITCDSCKQVIEGPLIQCMHCPSVSLCLHCSMTVNFEPGNHVVPSHHHGHVCCVYMGNQPVYS
jgi:hypothetical protein